MLYDNEEKDNDHYNTLFSIIHCNRNDDFYFHLYFFFQIKYISFQNSNILHQVSLQKDCMVQKKLQSE